MTGDLETASPDVHGCQLHRSHRPLPLVIVKHHVQPLGMDGADDSTNWAWVCDTGHRNVHTLMGPLVNGGTMPAGGTRSERHLAQTGYEMWLKAGRPGNPHAAYGVVDAGPGVASQ